MESAALDREPSGGPCFPRAGQGREGPGAHPAPAAAPNPSCQGGLTGPARRRWSAGRARRSGGARSSSARRHGGTAGSADLRGAGRQQGPDTHTDTSAQHHRHARARWKPLKAARGGQEQRGSSTDYAPRRPLNTGGTSGMSSGHWEWLLSGALRCGHTPSKPRAGGCSTSRGFSNTSVELGSQNGNSPAEFGKQEGRSWNLA